MRIAIIVIPILVLLIVLPPILAEGVIKPADVSSSSCIDCHKLDEIGLVTTEGIPISNEYEWQNHLHRALSNPDCLLCHSTHGTELMLFQHDLLTASYKNKCASCHIDLIPDDTIHSESYSCGNCHSTQSWSSDSFEHDRYFIFDNHHPSTCDNCHLVAGDFSQYSCFGACHEHTEAEIRSEHIEEGIYNYSDCAECHSSGRE